MSVKIKVSSNGVPSWKNVSQIKIKINGAWKNVSQAKLKVSGSWKNIFSSSLIPSIQTRVTISLSGGINASNNIMNDSDRVTITSTRYHWEDADGYTYAWQKSSDNLNWEDIGSAQSTTNPASGSSSSSLTLTLSPAYFTSGPDMYFRFSYRATNSIYNTSASSESLSRLVSYYGTPVPQPGSPSITGSTVVGNTASANIGTWTNSPTSYDYNVFYTSGLSVYPLTYAGIKSVSSKFLSGFSAALVTSSAHGYKTNDTVVVSGMDSLFNGSHTITARTNSTIFFTLPTPTAFSITSSVVSGTFRSFNGDAYRAISNLDASTAWTDAGTGYSIGDNVYYNSNRYRANSSLSSVSAYSGGTFYSVGQIVYANNNRYQSKTNGNQGNSFTNTTYWTDLGSFAPGVNSMWTSVMPSNTSFWTLQSFSDEPASGTTTAPNYYEGTVSSSTSIPIPITTFDYKQGIDLRGATTSGSGAVLSFAVKAYNQATLSPSEYLGQAFIYGVPILSIGSISTSSTSASVPFTSSYISGYSLNLYTEPSITNVIGGTSTVTYFAQNTFTSGQQVSISGINPSQYNGTRTIQSATATSFTVSANITGSYVSGGTAKVTVSGYPLPVNSRTSPRSITGLSKGTTYYLEMTPYNNGMNGTMQTSSFTTPSPPENTSLPTITPLNNRGRLPALTTLSRNLGSWINVNANTTYSTTWYKEDSVTGVLTNFGTGSTKDFGTVDVSDFVFVTITATNTNGEATTVTSQYYTLDQVVAVGNVSPTSAIEDAETTFTFSITHYPTDYVVDWGDGTSNSYSVSSNTLNVSASIKKTYTTPGDKTITVTANPGVKQSVTTIGIVSPPASPTGLYADSISKDSFFLGWNAVSTATTYDFGVSTSNTSPPSTLITSGNPGPGQYRTKSVIDTSRYEIISSLSPSTDYYGWVRASNSAGSSSWSVSAKITTLALKPPNPVTSLTHVSADRTQTSLKFSWTIPTTSSTNNAATHYIYHTSSTNSEPTLVNYNGYLDGGSNASATISSLSSNTLYYFWIRAGNADGYSTVATSSGTTLAVANPPGAPTTAGFTVPSPSGLTLGWTKGTGGDPTSYEIAISTSTTPPTSTSTSITTYIDKWYDVGTVTSYRVLGLSPGTTYYGWVRAKNADGTSGNSNRPNATTRTVTITNPKWDTTSPSNFQRNTGSQFMRWGWNNGTTTTSGTGTGGGLTQNGFYYEIYTTATGTTLWDSGYRAQRTTNSPLTVNGTSRIYVQNYTTSTTPAYTTASRFGRIQIECYDVDFSVYKGAWTGRI
jgi:hypothetical protein